METFAEIKSDSLSIKPYVVIVQPRRNKAEIPAQKFDCALGAHVDLLGYSHGFCDIGGEVVDVARNYLYEQALTSGAKYAFSVGEDTVVPYDAFMRLHETAEANPGAMVVGVYYIKLSSPMIMVKDGSYIKVADVTPGQVFEAWMVGLDCALIPMALLQAMKDQDPELPFCCICNDKGIGFIGEDNFFVHRVHKLNCKILVNTDVQALHVDLATGKYTAHPSVDLKKYFTNFPITSPLKWDDKQYIDERWINRLPKQSTAQEIKP
jgi:hypothetical protein